MGRGLIIRRLFDFAAPAIALCFGLTLSACGDGFLNPPPPNAGSKDGPSKDISDSLKLLSVANRFAFVGSPVEVNTATRTITLSNLPAGRMYTLNLREDGAEIADSSSFSCQDSDLSETLSGQSAPRVFAFVKASALHFDLGTRKSDGTTTFHCQTPQGGNFNVIVNYLRSQTALVSSSMNLSSAGLETGNYPSISQDGNRVAWVANDFSRTPHAQILVRSIREKTTYLVSSVDGLTPGDDDSTNSQISSDGRYVVFVSLASNFTTGASGNGWQIYLKDLQNPTQAPRIVSSLDSTQADQTNFAGNADCLFPQITADGRYVIFYSSATNFVTGGSGQQVYLKDLQNPALPPKLVSSLDSTQADQTSFKSNANNFSPQITPDGRYVVFYASATNLVTGGTGFQIYLKDLQNPALPPKLVSSLDSTQANQTGFEGNLPSSNPNFSSDGRYVVFQSSATNFVTGGSGSQIYLKDLQNPAQAPKLLSSTDSTQVDQTSFRGNGNSAYPQISPDGRYVVFESLATNLVTGLSGVAYQVFLVDLQNPSQAPKLVSSLDSTQADQTSFKGSGNSYVPRISGDGRYVTFYSDSPNLATGASGNLIFVKDLQNPALAPKLLTSTVSSQADQTIYRGNNISANAQITPDGRYAVFSSSASNLASAGVSYQIYLKDLHNPAQALKVVSSTDSTQADQTAFKGNGNSLNPQITPDGRYVVFESIATNFVTGGAGNQIYIKDLQNPAQAPKLVSSTDSTQANQTGFKGNGNSAEAHLTPDGRYVVFESVATNLVTGGSGQQIYIKDLQNPTQAPKVVSSTNSSQANQTGFEANGVCYASRITPDGRYVVFQSSASNLVTGGSGFQIYLKDLQNPTQAPIVVSSLDSTQADQTNFEGDGDSNEPQVTSDGRYVVFQSIASNLVTGGSGYQIYLKDLQNPTQAPIVVSSIDSTQADQTSFEGDGDSDGPQITPDGHYIVFVSWATNLVAGGGDGSYSQVYLKDLQNPAQKPVLISSADSTEVDQSAVHGDSDSSNPQFSSDGRYVVFESSASNLVTTGTGHQIYLKDMQALLP